MRLGAGFAGPCAGAGHGPGGAGHPRGADLQRRGGGIRHPRGTRPRHARGSLRAGGGDLRRGAACGFDRTRAAARLRQPGGRRCGGGIRAGQNRAQPHEPGMDQFRDGAQGDQEPPEPARGRPLLRPGGRPGPALPGGPVRRGVADRRTPRCGDLLRRGSGPGRERHPAGGDHRLFPRLAVLPHPKAVRAARGDRGAGGTARAIPPRTARRRGPGSRSAGAAPRTASARAR